MLQDNLSSKVYVGIKIIEKYFTRGLESWIEITPAYKKSYLRYTNEKDPNRNPYQADIEPGKFINLRVVEVACDLSNSYGLGNFFCKRE